VKNEPNHGHTLSDDLLKGFGLSFGVGAIVLAITAPVGYASPAMGLWFVWLFAWRDAWIPSFARVIYRRRWSRAITWPYAAADIDSFIRIFRAISWGWLLLGVTLFAVELIVTTPS
jgi:hypothetical protein